MRSATILAGFGLTLTTLATACNTEPVDGLSAETEFVHYGTDSDIVVTITNESDQEVAYIACPSIWENQDSGDRVEGLEACTREFTTVGAHSSVDVTYHFRVNQPLGTWRIVIPVGPSDEAAEIRTNEFEIVVTAE